MLCSTECLIMPNSMPIVALHATINRFRTEVLCLPLETSFFQPYVVAATLILLGASCWFIDRHASG
jgi:hypothetical protein